jgi:hypothetical protein
MQAIEDLAPRIAKEKKEMLLDAALFKVDEVAKQAAFWASQGGK